MERKDFEALGIDKKLLEELKASDLNYNEISEELNKKAGQKVASKKKLKHIFELFGVAPRTKEESLALRTRKVVSSGVLKKDVKKWQTMFSKEQMDDIVSSYKNGESAASLSRRYKTTTWNIYGVLEDNDLEVRGNSLSKRAKTFDVLKTKPNDFYIELFESHQEWSLTDLVISIQEMYPDEELPFKSVYGFIRDELKLDPDEERKRRARSIKSRQDHNPSWKIRQDSIKALEKTHYKTVDNLAYLYSTTSIGSFAMIADELNREQDDFTFTEGRVSKLITSSSKYVRRQSSTERAFISDVVEALSLDEKDYVTHSRTLLSDKSEIDLYVPSLGIAFEFNGDYWHSDEVTLYNDGVTAKKKHSLKRKLAKDAGIKLLYVWESDYLSKRSEIVELIKNRSWSSKLLNMLSKEASMKYKTRNRLYVELSDLDINCESVVGGFVKSGDVYVRYAKTSGSLSSNKNIYKKMESEGERTFFIYPWFDMESVAFYLDDCLLNRESRRYRFLLGEGLLGYTVPASISSDKTTYFASRGGWVSIKNPSCVEMEVEEARKAGCSKIVAKLYHGLDSFDLYEKAGFTKGCDLDPEVLYFSDEYGLLDEAHFYSSIDMLYEEDIEEMSFEDEMKELGAVEYVTPGSSLWFLDL